MTAPGYNPGDPVLVRATAALDAYLRAGRKTGFTYDARPEDQHRAVVDLITGLLHLAAYEGDPGADTLAMEADLAFAAEDDDLHGPAPDLSVYPSVRLPGLARAIRQITEIEGSLDHQQDSTT